MTPDNVHSVMREVKHQLDRFESAVANSMADVVEREPFDVSTKVIFHQVYHLSL